MPSEIICGQPEGSKLDDSDSLLDAASAAHMFAFEDMSHILAYAAHAFSFQVDGSFHAQVHDYVRALLPATASNALEDHLEQSVVHIPF